MIDTGAILVKPIITEKSMDEVTVGRFTFAVLKTANKADIKRAIEAEFNVHVKALQTLIAKGKRQKVGKKRVEIAGKAWKKAIVTLKEGEKIDLFEPQTEEKKAKT